VIKTKGTRPVIAAITVAIAMTAPALVGLVQAPTETLTLVTVVEVTATTDYEYGLKIGGLFAENYRYLASTFFEKVKGEGIDAAEISIKAGELIDVLNRYYPPHLERLKGLSDRIGIPLEDLVAIELYGPGLFRFGFRGCTTSASAPPATGDSKTYITWNIDGAWDMWKLFQFRIPHLVVNTVLGHNRYISWGVPILFEDGILNEKGLACTANTNTQTKGTGMGLLPTWINAMAMATCSNVYEVAELIASLPRFSGSDPLTTMLGTNYLWADAHGGIASTEWTHSHFGVKFGEETGGIMGQANHNQWLDRNLTGGLGPDESPSTYARCARMWGLLREHYGHLDLATMKSIVSDHGPGNPHIGNSMTICRHFDPEAGLNQAGTGVCLIIEPNERVINWCPGHPCREPFFRLYYGWMS